MIFKKLHCSIQWSCFIVTAWFLLFAETLTGQCVVFNEVMINGGTSNDGSNSPNTEEWVELYNTCNQPVDLSCFVITDGDFSATFPSGSIIQPFGFFSIGSINSGFAVDLNWATCNCTDGNTIGVFTNGTEQLVLLDENETVMDAIIWGGGQLPVDITTSAIPGCGTINIHLTNSNTIFTNVPIAGSSDDGCTIGLMCDGGDVWQLMCGSDITPGISNPTGDFTLDFSATDQTICAGTCIDFTDESSPATSWNWTFEGANATTSNAQNPTGICYNNAGDFDVTLEITSSCGTQSITLPDFIHVDANITTNVTADGPLTFCTGSSVSLDAAGTGPFTWTQNDLIIAGASSSQYLVTESGTYNVTNEGVACPLISADFVVLVNEGISIDFSSSEQTICSGSCIQFTDECSDQPDSWNWSFEGAITSTSSVENPGNICYDNAGTFDVTLEITDACGTHNLVLQDYIQVLSNLIPVLTANGNTTICDGETVSLTTTGTGPFEWNLNGVVLLGETGNQLTASDPGDYTASTTNEICPQTSNSIAVVLLDDVPTAIAPNSDVILCESSLQLQATTPGSIQWLLNGVPIPGATQPTLTATANGNYQYESAAVGYCPSHSDEIFVSLNNDIGLVVALSADTICEGETATLTAIGFFDDVEWSTGETTSSIVVNNTGNYNVQVSFSTCTADSILHVEVLPLPQVNAGEDLISPCDGMLLLSGSGEGNLSWLYNNQQIADSSEVFVEAPTKNSIYTLKAEQGGCVSTDEVLVTSDCISIFIPNAFTPNSDGVNDVFKVEVRGVLNYEFFIFNRWGDVVFHSTDPDEVWTGGKHDYFVPDGVYTYFVKGVNSKFENILDSAHSRGTITVLR